MLSIEELKEAVELFNTATFCLKGYANCDSGQLTIALGKLISLAEKVIEKESKKKEKTCKAWALSRDGKLSFLQGKVPGFPLVASEKHFFGTEDELNGIKIVPCTITY